MPHTSSKQVRCATRQSRRPLVCLAAVALLVLGLPGEVAAGPALDEYTLEIPGPKGPKTVESGGQGSQPNALPPSVRDELAGTPRDQLLVQVATSPDLAAPGPPSRKGGGSRVGIGGGADGGSAGDSAGTSAGDSAGTSNSGSAKDSVLAIAAGVAGDGGSGAALLAGLVLVTIAVALWGLLGRRRTDGDA